MARVRATLPLLFLRQQALARFQNQFWKRASAICRQSRCIANSSFGIAADRKHAASAIFIKKKSPFIALKESMCIPKLL